jgi:hypothetical protein
MKVRLSVGSAALAIGLVAGGAILAQGPANNVNPSRNPNLAAAQKLVTQAFEKITIAQQANKEDMKGHASKAKELLIQANKELKIAADIADQKHK